MSCPRERFFLTEGPDDEEEKIHELLERNAKLHASSRRERAERITEALQEEREMGREEIMRADRVRNGPQRRAAILATRKKNRGGLLQRLYRRFRAS